ncbi:MAG TPA: deoxyribonuclease IV [Gemmatimonadaceae bacterium]
MTHYFGAHTIDNGGINMAARRAGAAGMKALQIFTTIPKFYGDKATIKPDRVDRFRAALADTKIDPKFVVAHGAYVLNTATPDEEKSSRARAGLAKELERSTALGIGAICFHPGAATDDDREAAAERVARAIVHALETVPEGTTRVLVENTAGAGRTFAKTAAEVSAILHHVPKQHRARTGYGLDTCHLFASGYDLTAAPDAVSKVLDEFESATGEAPSFFHLNDSQGAMGSNKDRHMLIGEGLIGVDPFRQLIADRRSQGIPLILETPQANFEIAEDDATADEYDVRMMKLLQSLVD